MNDTEPYHMLYCTVTRVIFSLPQNDFITAFSTILSSMQSQYNWEKPQLDNWIFMTDVSLIFIIILLSQSVV